MRPIHSSHPSAASSAAMVALSGFVAGFPDAVESMSVHDVRRHMHLVRAARAVIDARELALHQRMTELSITPGSPCAIDPQREIVRHAGLRQRDTRILETRSSAVAAAPILGDLLTAGATTSGHLDAVGHALAAAGHDRDLVIGQMPQIAQRAATSDADSFQRYMKHLVREIQTDDGMNRFRQQQRSTEMRVWNDRDGMVRVSGAFDPERGAALVGCLDRHVETMFHSGDKDIPLDVAPGIDPNNHRRALALHHLCTRSRSASTSTIGDADGQVDPFDARPSRAEVVVHVDYATLVSGHHSRSVCRTSHGSDIPPAVARRLACEAEIIPVVLSGDSVPLDVGRAKRLATVHQRRALEAHYSSCAIDGCDTPFTRCVIHHLDAWEHGGPTTLDNLVPLCSRHHHRVHDDGWRLRLDPSTRQLAVTLPGIEVADNDDPDVNDVDTSPQLGDTAPP
jgi:hypothetical protein